MPRFAIVAHDHPSPHWDLFLEAGPVLRSWRILAPITAADAVPVEPTPDHRLLYLDYEGLVSGNRGTVTRVDAGEFTWEADEPDRLIIRLLGTRFVGTLTIRSTDIGWACGFVSG